MFALAGSTMAGDWIEVWPPSTSWEPTAEPAASPVTKQLAEASQLPGCTVVPSYALGCGSPRCHWPVVAWLPPGVSVQPRADSKSSLNNVLEAAGWNSAVKVVSLVGVTISCV